MSKDVITKAELNAIPDIVADAAEYSQRLARRADVTALLGGEYAETYTRGYEAARYDDSVSAFRRHMAAEKAAPFMAGFTAFTGGWRKWNDPYTIAGMLAVYARQEVEAELAAAAVRARHDAAAALVGWVGDADHRMLKPGTMVSGPHGVAGVIDRFSTYGQDPDGPIDRARVTVWVRDAAGREYACRGRDLRYVPPPVPDGDPHAVIISDCGTCRRRHNILEPCEGPDRTCETCGHPVEVSVTHPGLAPEHVNPEDDDHSVVVA